VQHAAADQIGMGPIGRAPVVKAYQTQVSGSILHSGEIVDAASDSIASKLLHAPMLGKKNPMPMTPTAC